jgi:lysophospholipid acyltransferase (LPLAT)-like uncharacterized protein
MSTPGVGAIVALTYVAAIDDPARFKSSKGGGASMFQETGSALTAAALVGSTLHNAAGAAVTAVTAVQSGANVLITIDPNSTITLNNVSLTTLRSSAAADIHFVTA